jgi:hypothetical protein
MPHAPMPPRAPRADRLRRWVERTRDASVATTVRLPDPATTPGRANRSDKPCTPRNNAEVRHLGKVRFHLVGNRPTYTVREPRSAGSKDPRRSAPNKWLGTTRMVGGSKVGLADKFRDRPHRTWVRNEQGAPTFGTLASTRGGAGRPSFVAEFPTTRSPSVGAPPRGRQRAL